MPRSPRPRRSTQQLRDDLLAAARELFSARGFASTSTRDIAERAGAAEQLIFKHFKTKAGLFAAAVFEPLSTAFDGQLAHIEDSFRQPVPVQQRITNFVEMLLPSLLENRRLLVAYLNAATFHEGDFASAGEVGFPSLIDYLRRLEEMHNHAPEGTRIVVDDPLMETRLSFALVFAVVLFQDLIFAPEERDEKRELAAIVKLLSTGLGADTPGTSQRESMTKTDGGDKLWTMMPKRSAQRSSDGSWRTRRPWMRPGSR
jgi:AcrR family transcriptional regulator